jgi:membrane associated rhomboid family serine protease
MLARMETALEPDQTPPAERERLFNIPWPVTALVGVLLAIFAVEAYYNLGQSAEQNVQDMCGAWGFRAADLFDGRIATLVTSIFVHGSWAHVLMNCAFLVAFGAPVARRMGEGPRGALCFYTFYMACGVVANLTYALLNPGHENPVVGASGAIAALMGGASRLIRRAPDEPLAPFMSADVLGLAAGWVLINLIFGVVLKRWSPGSGGMLIAWQVHLAGYALGLFLLAPALRLVGRR